MNWHAWLIWGFAATLTLSTISAAAQGLGFTRMNLPLLLGSMFTGARDRDRALWFGTAAHFAIGWAFALFYIAIFGSLASAGMWPAGDARVLHALLGAALGAFHAIVVLVFGVSLLPTFHRGMASEQYGPTANRLLEPPGFFAMHYGPSTPVVILVSHMIYGAILGFFY